MKDENGFIGQVETSGAKNGEKKIGRGFGARSTPSLHIFYPFFQVRAAS